MIENTQSQRWKHGIEDVVEGKCPGFVNDLSGENVLEGKLKQKEDSVSKATFTSRSQRAETYPELRQVQSNVLVE